MRSTPAVDACMLDFFSLQEQEGCKISQHNRKRIRPDWLALSDLDVQHHVGLHFIMPLLQLSECCLHLAADQEKEAHHVKV